MITAQELQTIVSVLATALAVTKNSVTSPLTIIRKNQLGDKLEHPFGAYQVITDSKVYEHQASVFPKDAYLQNGDIDPTKIKLERRKLAYGIFSFEIVSASFGEARSLADRAWDFLDSTEAMSAFRTHGFTPSLVSSEIQDRTTVIPGIPLYEYRYGFDFKLEIHRTKTTTVDAVNEISNQVTLEE